MKTFFVRAAATAAVLSILGCSGDGGGGGKSNVVFRGSITGLGSTAGAQPSTLSDVDVEGMLAGDALNDVSSNDDGEYTLKLNVDGPQTVVVAFRNDGYAPLYRTIDVAPGAEIPLSVTLREMDTLDCAAGDICNIAGNRLSIAGLPDGYSGGARVFNPVTESDAFPGGFSDSTGALLLSGTFAAIELENEVGDPVDTLPADVELRMAFPRDTWNIVVDITPGNSQVDVPMYAFDESLGTWVSEGEGVLEDADGVLLAEADVALLKNGTYDGTVYARATVSHFSYWNVDWPIETHTCITGTIVDENGNPAEGATVTVSGVTYGGSSTPQTVGVDGRFCVDIMKSEIVGEDVDNDGIPNETQQVAIRVFHEGEVYDGGTFDSPAAQGTCAAGTCTDLGEIPLNASTQLQVALCTINGDLLLDGTGVADASVFGWDDSVPNEVFTELCGAGGCIPASSTGPAGDYTIVVPVLSGVRMMGYSQTVDGPDQIFRYGQAFVPKCPTSDIDITLTDGYAYTTLTVTVTGNTIDWTPARPAQFVLVQGAAGMKWFVASESSMITPPVTYGSIPAGAIQIEPASGLPPALAAGDQVQISTVGTTSSGLPSYGSGVGVVQ